ncbi:hypothetical protein MTO96_009916 [Rhipicephalus appendiculatus]
MRRQGNAAPRLQREASATLTPSGIRPPRVGFPRTPGRERLREPMRRGPAHWMEPRLPPTVVVRSRFVNFPSLKQTRVPAQSTMRLHTSLLSLDAVIGGWGACSGP